MSGTLRELLLSVTYARRMPMAKTTFVACRRVNDRRFLLRPDAKLTALVTWLLAVCAPLFDVEVHAMTVMSSHYHLVFSAADQRASAFFEKFNANIAKAVNVLRRMRRGVVWEPGNLNIVELKTVDAVVFDIAYAIANPVAAGLVWSPEDWPGLSVQVEEMGCRVLEESRPGFFFGPSWQKHAALEITLPPCLLELGEDEARERIGTEVRRQVAEARAEIRKHRYCVLGPVAARNVSPSRPATSWETFGVVHPTFATGPRRVVERIAAALEVIAFRQEYRSAWLRYRDGEEDVVFPYGTYLMRVRHAVRVATAPT